ncbi:hypothetical protein [Roseateles sp. LYH14W]|uniref:Uncharacterized protein n=1 Tax=Pelomonas parva TaxID=3299032 RepID=A0ABW7EY65_9BURK
MSASAAALVRSWRVGNRTATLTVSQPSPDGQRAAVIEWAPTQPQKLTKAQFKQYRRGRDAALLSLGIPVLVVEV